MKDDIKVEKLGVILSPTNNSFEAKGVLNPGCVQEGNFVHLFYRAVDSENISTIGYAKLKGPTKIIKRMKSPIINKDYEYENKGVEDARIVKIGKTFYLTYVAHDGKNALTVYATSQDLKKFKKRGIITAQMQYKDIEKIIKNDHLKNTYSYYASFYKESAGEDVLLWGKDVFFFPKKIKGKYALIHRVLPGIQIAYFNNFKELQTDKFWIDYFKKMQKYIILESDYWFETSHIGGGPPPVETKEGWLLIMHSVEKKEEKVGEEIEERRIYHASAALLDKNDPTKVIGRLKRPLFSPDQPWEKEGFVNNVVFPSGTAIFKKHLYIYYGAADDKIAIAKVELESLIKNLKNNL